MSQELVKRKRKENKIKKINKISPFEKTKLELKIDTDLLNKKHFTYNEKENTIEKNDEESQCGCCLKKISKKNCDTKENSFTIKILNSDECDIWLSLCRLNLDFKNWEYSGENLKELGYHVALGDFKRTWEESITEEEGFIDGFLNTKVGDVICFKYNSKKGVIEIIINNISKGVIISKIDTSVDYRFGMIFYFEKDKIQIIN